MNKLYNNKYDILASTIQPNPISAKYWADLASDPHGGDLKYFNGEKWVLVNDKATEAIKDLQSDLTNEINRATAAEQTINDRIEALIGDAPAILDPLPELIDEIASKATQESVDTLNSTVSTLSTTVANKVDKVDGKQLSTEDYTTAEKEKLASLNNYDDSTITASITALQTGKVDKDGSKVLSDNNYTTEEKTKLAGLSNYVDTEVRELIAALTTRVSTLETNYTALEERVSALETPTA